MNNPFGRAGEWPDWPPELVDRSINPYKAWLLEADLERAMRRAHHRHAVMNRVIFWRARRAIRRLLRTIFATRPDRRLRVPGYNLRHRTMEIAPSAGARNA